MYADSQQAALEQVAAFVAAHEIDCDFRRAPHYVFAESSSDVSKIEDDRSRAKDRPAGGVQRRRAAAVRGRRLHTLSPVCTHLACHVSWNRAEKSWDCPCHGSRFAPEGGGIQGPAVRDLQRVDLERIDAGAGGLGAGKAGTRDE